MCDVIREHWNGTGTLSSPCSRDFTLCLWIGRSVQERDVRICLLLLEDSDARLTLSVYVA